MNNVKETIGKIVDLGLSGKAISAIGKIWHSQSGLAQVDSVTSRFAIRPRLAAKMAEAGLIELKKVRGGSLVFAALTSLGGEFALGLFENE